MTINTGQKMKLKQGDIQTRVSCKSIAMIVERQTKCKGTIKLAFSTSRGWFLLWAWKS